MSSTQIEVDDSYTVNRRRFSSSWSYELNSRTPVQLSWKQMVSVTLHWRCLTLTIFLLICFSLLIWCKVPNFFLRTASANPPCRNGLIWIPTTITLVFYLLYWVECFHCTIHKGFENLISAENAEVILQRWINAKPVIRWKAVCYHYSRNNRQRNSGGSNGSQTLPQLQYTRVNSYSIEGRYHPYDCGCLDKSTPLRDISSYSIIKVDLEKTFSFGCSCSEAAYIAQRKAFYHRHMTIDDFIELTEIFHLAGSQIPDSLCIVRTNKGVPWYCNKIIFWFFSLFCLSWPLRILIERRTAYAALAIHKEFGGECDGVLATSGHSISSYDSKISENIYGIIPSYSQALLMSSYTLNGTRIPSTITIANQKNMTRAGTYDAISSNADQSAQPSKHKQKKLRTRTLFLSKTADNLQCTQSSSRMYKAPPTRSLSLYYPTAERPQCLLTAAEATAQLALPTTKTSVTRKHKSSSSMANTIRNIFSPTSRSTTFDEQIHLL